MENDIILKVDNVSKQYRLGVIGTGTISHDLNRWWNKVRGKSDPFLKIGEENDRSTKGNSDYVWAINNIDFEVKRGEVLGIIGKNGAGKSTLLKILSRVTGPTTGEIKTKGRIASLLEVGTGFHPEMTGRENVFLNGAILGMTKTEINSKIDEIIEFSGCQRYIDTPVKRYSSGMTVRLAFAVAAHLEPDILVIDEVLAVGDAEFQKKAIGKMQDISKGQGRTVLFVSHNMAAVRNLCTRALVLQNGSTVFEGKTNEAIDFYLKSDVANSSAQYINETPNAESDILEVSMRDENDKVKGVFEFDSKIFIKIKFNVTIEKLKYDPIIGIRINDQHERNIFTTQKHLSQLNTKDGLNELMIELPTSFLVPNIYYINFGYHIKNIELIASRQKVVSFKIEETGTDFSTYSSKDYGCVIVECNWNKK